MKTIYKISILTILFLIFCITSVNAFGISMDLEDYDQSTIDTQLETNEDIQFEEDLPIQEENLNETENADINENDTPRVTSSTTSSDEDEFLTVENILSIIIIVIGILLVLLAIAILIRFK